MEDYSLQHKKAWEFDGFTLIRFDEHPSWENDKLPGEFTAVAVKQ